MRSAIIFFMIACCFVPQASLSDTTAARLRLVIDNISLSPQSKLNSDFLSDELRAIAEADPGMYHIVPTAKDLQFMAERLKIEHQVGIPPVNLPDFAKVKADFVLSPRMQEENGQFNILAKIYNLTSPSVEIVVGSGNTTGQALLNLWEAVRFFNVLEIVTSGHGVNPSKDGITGLTYTIFCGDAVRTISYEQDNKGEKLLPVEVSDRNDLFITYCYNPSKYAIASYQADLRYMCGGVPKSISSGRIPLTAAHGRILISYISDSAKWGIKLIEIDARNFWFNGDAKELAEKQQDILKNQEYGKTTDAANLINPNNFPEYITGTVKHGRESLSFTIKPSNKDDDVVMRFKHDDQPIAVEMEAHGYNVQPRTRNYVSEDVANLKVNDNYEVIVLDNEDFK